MNTADTKLTAAAVFQSGMYPNIKNEAQAFVLILAGAEMGVGPIEAVSGIALIQGKPTISADLLATLVKRHPRYDYRVIDHSETVCRIEFSQDGEVNGVSEFTTEDAQKAGLTGPTWKKYTKALLFARALTQGTRWYCPDVTSSAAYTPEELGAEIDQTSDEGAGSGNAPAVCLSGVAPSSVEPRPIDELAALMSEHGFSTEDKAGIRDWLKAEPERKDEKISDAIALLENGETDGLRVCAGFDAETVNGEVVK